MKINLDVLGALMLDLVGGHVNCTDVVAVYQCRVTVRCMELLKKLAQPCGLGDTISHRAILGFSTRSGDGVLMLRGLGDEIVPKKHSIA